MINALEQYYIEGVEHNVAFLISTLKIKILGVVQLVQTLSKLIIQMDIYIIMGLTKIF